MIPPLRYYLEKVLRVVWGLRLSGRIPDAVSAWTELNSLHIERTLLCSLPDGVASFAKLRGVSNLADNRLSGPIPDAVASWAKLKKLRMNNNALSGHVPSAVSSWTDMTKLEMKKNQLSGAIPGAVASLTMLEHVDLSYNRLVGTLLDGLFGCTQMRLEQISIEKNQLSGAIPGAASSLTMLKTLQLSHNRLVGAIPEGVHGSTKMHLMILGSNELSGTIPHGRVCLRILMVFENMLSGPLPVFSSSIKHISVRQNKLSNAIPGSVASWLQMTSFYAASNALSGSIPDSMAFWFRMKEISLERNSLRGSIPVAIAGAAELDTLDVAFNALSGTLAVLAPKRLLVAGNKLTGSLPASSRHDLFLAYLSGNLFEGTIPGGAMKSTSMEFLSVSKNAGQAQGLEGVLPFEASRLTDIKHLIASYHNLEGPIPSLATTLSNLALQHNRFRLFLGASWKEDHAATVLLQGNLLSCHPPKCGGVGTEFCLAALGNYLQSSRNRFPQWVSPMERDNLFWTSGREGCSLLLKLVGAISIVAPIVGHNLYWSTLHADICRWYTRPLPQMGFALALSGLLHRITREVLLRICIVVLLLLSWDGFACPPAFVLASACLRDGTLQSLLVLFLWSQMCFNCPELECFAIAGRNTAATKSSRKSLILWLGVPLLASVLSLGEIT